MAKVLVLYNAPVLPNDHPDAESERDVLHTVEAVEAALLHHQHQAKRFGLHDSPQELLNHLQRQPADVVFNLFEGFGHSPASEYHVAGLLAWLGLPLTGCPVEAMVLGRDKVRTKQLLHGAGLRTAAFQVAQQWEEVQSPTSWPRMVKPAATDASIGIHQQSVVQSIEELRRQFDYVLDNYGSPVLIEEYLPGPEFNVGVVERPQCTALPVAEMVYTQQPGVSWPIVSYASKWEPGSAEDLAMQPRCPAQIGETLRGQLQRMAMKAFQLIGCRDYARVDLRLDAAGQPCILEVNPNPDLGPTAGLARMLKVEGMTYDQFIHQLVVQHL
jgi:D-alanine-D-alanine ligase